jgi:hypothetical protein|tara:strand:- start:11533 stop:11700 length:168 start_codon:yes stop_codon:yes gene_type:complete
MGLKAWLPKSAIQRAVTNLIDDMGSAERVNIHNFTQLTSLWLKKFILFSWVRWKG